MAKTVPSQRSAVVFASGYPEADAVLARLEKELDSPFPFQFGRLGDWRVAVMNLEECDEDTGLVEHSLSATVRTSIHASVTASTKTAVAVSERGAVSVKLLLELAANELQPSLALFVGPAKPLGQAARGKVIVGSPFRFAERSWSSGSLAARTRRDGMLIGDVASEEGLVEDDTLALDILGPRLVDPPEPLPIASVAVRGLCRDDGKGRQSAAERAADLAFDILLNLNPEGDDLLALLRSKLLALKPREFEDVASAALSAILGIPFRKAAAGSQPSGDSGGGTVRLEAKRYRNHVPETLNLLGGLSSAVDEVPDLSHWVVATTVGLPSQAIDRLHRAAQRNRVTEVVLDWPDIGTPPLAAALVAGRDEVSRKFPTFGPLLADLAKRPELAEAGERVADALHSAPPIWPIQLPLYTYRPELSATAQLDPRFRTVPLLGREREMADWVTWARQGNQIVRLLTGDGGTGKTRLLMEVCLALKAQGWNAGFLQRNPNRDHLRRQLSGKGRIFLAIDYAERRAEDLDLLCETIQEARPHIRLALLARREGAWLDELRARGGTTAYRLGAADVDALTLEPVAPNGERRSNVFDVALSAFAATIGISPPENRLRLDEAAFDAPENDRILFLLLRAWAAVHGPSAGSPLEAAINREYRYLQNLAPGISPHTMMEVLAWIFVRGGAPTRREAITLLSKCPSLEGLAVPTIAEVATVFHNCYCGPLWLNPIQPDLIGETIAERYGAST